MADHVDLRTSTVEPAVKELRALLRIGDSYLRLAVESVLANAGIEIVDADDGRAYLVTDDLRQQSPRSVLVIDENAATSQTALQALTARKIAAVLSRQDPGRLPLVLQCADGRMATVPYTVLDVVKNTPDLGDRQLQILAMVTQGMSNSRIAERLHVSDATIKREVSALLRAFDCSSRLELAMKSTRAGSVGV